MIALEFTISEQNENLRSTYKGSSVVPTDAEAEAGDEIVDLIETSVAFRGGTANFKRFKRGTFATPKTFAIIYLDSLTLHKCKTLKELKDRARAATIGTRPFITLDYRANGERRMVWHLRDTCYFSKR